GQQQKSEGDGELSPQVPSRSGREERALARYAISIHCITKYTLKKATAKAIAPIPKTLEKPTPTPKAISRRPKRIPTIASELSRARSSPNRFRKSAKTPRSAQLAPPQRAPARCGPGGASR